MRTTREGCWWRAKMVDLSVIILSLIVTAKVAFSDEPNQSKTSPKRPENGHHFNAIIGTQSIGVGYKFTKESPNIETAKVIAEMGSRILKVNLNSMSKSDLDALLAMDFDTYLFWFNGSEKWVDGLTHSEKERLYQEIYRVGERLLLASRNKGPRDFYLGHWEGDWQLLQGFDGNKDAGPIETQGMIDWLNTRQAAISDLRKVYEGEASRIFHYTEVNRVVDALEKGKIRMVNAVLPYVDVDYVSYSAYDVQQKSQADLSRVLDHVAAQLKHRPDISEKRILVTEMGLSADVMNYNRVEHERRNRELMVKFIRWGAPMVLYWQVYNNEVRNGKQRGFWLVDDKNERWPLYDTFAKTLRNGHSFVATFHETHSRPPTDAEYRSWLVETLTSAKKSSR